MSTNENLESSWGSQGLIATLDAEPSAAVPVPQEELLSRPRGGGGAGGAAKAHPKFNGDYNSDEHAVLSIYYRQDKIGLAKKHSQVLSRLGISVEASAGSKFRGAFVRQSLVTGSRESLKKLRRWGKRHSSMMAMSVEALPNGRTWTLSCCAPVTEISLLGRKSGPGSAGEVEKGTLGLLAKERFNIAFESRLVARAANSGIPHLHQHIVVVMPKMASIAVLDEVARSFAVTFGGNAEFLPGACCSVLNN